MKPRNTLTGPEEHEIAKRLAIRRAYSTKNLMREFNASRSAIDRISRGHKEILAGTYVPPPRKQSAGKRFTPYSDLTPLQKQRFKVRMAARTALKAGKITRGPCEKCGAEKAEMHHPDYSKPLLVVWLCQTCHRKLHRESILLARNELAASTVQFDGHTHAPCAR